MGKMQQLNQKMEDLKKGNYRQACEELAKLAAEQ